MRVHRIGLAALKGARHRALDSLRLDLTGPVGDRVFCLVDPARSRVLRTVEDPSLLQLVAHFDGAALTLVLPSGTVRGPVPRQPSPAGRRLRLDYWGREAVVDLLDGPWAAACSQHLGRSVELARVSRPGEVVYGAAVSIVTTGSLRALADRLGEPVDPAVVRATVVVDGDGRAELDWADRVLRLGDAEVHVRGPIPRCAVVGLDPVTGRRRTRALQELPRGPLGPVLGVDATVAVAGVVHRGDPVVLT